MHTSTLHAVILFCFISTHMSGQNDYHNGYIVDNFGNRLSCHIENHGNPYIGVNYFYNFEPRGELIQANVETISELNFEGIASFCRAYITVDVSSNQIRSLKDTAHHEELFAGHVLLLNLLKTENVDLYSFRYESEDYFFYRKDSSVVQNLIYKKYELVNFQGEVKQVLQDFTFRDQLKRDLPCSANVRKVDYSKNDLMFYFLSYLEENGKTEATNTNTSFTQDVVLLSDYTLLFDQTAEKEKASFDLSLTSSLYHTSFVIRDGDMVSFYFESKYIAAAGTECTLMLPFNKNCIGVFAGANYLHYYQENDIHPTVELSRVNIHAVDLPFGIEAHNRPFDKFSIYARLGLSGIFLLNDSYMSIYIPENYLEMKNALGYFFGGGISYGRFSVDASFFQTRNLSKYSMSNPSELHQFSFRLSYKIISTGRR